MSTKYSNPKKRAEEEARPQNVHTRIDVRNGTVVATKVVREPSPAAQSILTRGR